MEEGPKKTKGGMPRGGQHHGSRGARRNGQHPAPAPETTKKKGGFPVGIFIAAALGLLFVAYLTNSGNVQTSIDGFFGSQVQSAHTHDAFVTTWFMLLLPYVAMAMGIAVLYVMLASFGVGKTKRKPKPLSEEVSVHEFAEICTAAGVGPRVSREMYRMMLPYYSKTLRTTLTRSFEEMEVHTEVVWGMFEELVRKSGGVIRGHVGIEALGTPLAMMQAAEQCVERAALERRATLQKTMALSEETHRTVVPIPAGRH